MSHYYSHRGQRAILGDAVVEAAIGPLRSRLASLRALSAEQQRKYITILFAEIGGQAGLGESDAEELDLDLSAFWPQLDQVIRSLGGRIDKHIGSTVMALWGADHVQEDDPERAVRAALELREMLQANAFRWLAAGATLHMRVGLHTGQAVLGEVGTQGEFTAMGDAVNTASRIQHAAAPGEIYISHDTYRHVRGVFDILALAPLHVKGKVEPLRAYLVRSVKPRDFRDDSRGLEGVEVALVGREAELQTLRQAFSLAMNEQRISLVTLVGDAGVGKSRLLLEFFQWLDLQPEDSWFFRGRSAPSTSLLPYALLRDMFSFRFEIRESDPLDVVRRKLEAGFGAFKGLDDQAELPAAAQAQAHVVGALLGYDLADSPHLAWLSHDPRQLPERALHALVDFFCAAAHSSPVVLLLEDLHWADEQSLDMLERLMTHLPALRMLAVATARPTLYERRPGWGEGSERLQTVRLLPLTAGQSDQLLGSLLHKMPRVPPALSQLIVERAEGNPYYIEELVKMLVEDGTIVAEEPAWSVDLSRLVSSRVPPTLTGVLQARLDSLEPDEKIALQRASVLGRVFWGNAVAYLGHPNLPLRPEDVQALLGLRQRELVFQRSQSAFEETGEYIFKHALLRDVTYESVLKRDRRTYHARAADWLAEATQQRGRAEEYAALIAEHYEQAGDPLQAADWHRRAGAKAATLYANEQAQHAFRRALDLLPVSAAVERYEALRALEQINNLRGQRTSQLETLEALEEIVRQWAAQGAEERRQARVALRWSNYAEVTGDYPNAVLAARRAVDLAVASAAPDLEAQARLAWGRALWRQSEYAPSGVQLAQAINLAQQTGLVHLEAAAHSLLGRLAEGQSDAVQSCEYHQQALSLYRSLADRQGEAQEMIYLGNVGLVLDRRAESAQYYEQALLIAREIGDRLSESRSLGSLAVLAGDRGDFTRSLSYYSQALKIFREIGHRQGEAVALINLGNDSMAQGSYAQARQYMLDALALQRGLGHRMGVAIALDNLTLVHYYLGEYAVALDYIAQTLDLTYEINQRNVQAYALHHRGHIFLAQERVEEARHSYQQAYDLREEIGEHKLALESALGVAEASLALGEMEAARQPVEQALAFMAQGGDTVGMVEPLRVYWVSYRVLSALQDPRSSTILANGLRELEARSAQISDENMRQLFLNHVQTHKKLFSAAQAASKSASVVS